MYAECLDGHDLSLARDTHSRPAGVFEKHSLGLGQFRHPFKQNTHSTTQAAPSALEAHPSRHLITRI